MPNGFAAPPAAVPPPPPDAGSLSPAARPQGDLEALADELTSDSPAPSSAGHSDLEALADELTAAEPPTKIASSAPAPKPTSTPKLVKPPEDKPGKVGAKTVPNNVKDKINPVVSTGGQQVSKIPPPPPGSVNPGDYFRDAARNAYRSAKSGIRSAVSEYSKDPLHSAAATAAGIPLGLLTTGEDLAAIAGQAMGRPQQKNDRLSTYYRRSFNHGVQALVDNYPGAAGLGQLGGASLLPLPAAKAGVAGAALAGAGYGAGFGAVGQAGETARENKPQSAGEIGKAALSGAMTGAVVGGAAGKLLHRPEAAPEAPPSEHTIKLDDGKRISIQEATDLLDHPDTTKEVQGQIIKGLNKYDEHVAAGRTPEQARELEDAESGLRGYSSSDPSQLKAAALENMGKAKTVAELQQISSDAHKALTKNVKGPVQKEIGEALKQAYEAKAQGLNTQPANEPPPFAVFSREDLKAYQEHIRQKEIEAAGHELTGNTEAEVKPLTLEEFKAKRAQENAAKQQSAPAALPPEVEQLYRKKAPVLQAPRMAEPEQVAAINRERPITPEVPQNKPISRPPAEPELARPGRPPAEPQTPLKPSSEAGLVKAPPVVAPKNVLNPPAPKLPEITQGFQTAKGSTYEYHSDGTTTRTKSFHSEHGAFDTGLKPKSESTIFVTPEEASKLADFQARGASKQLAPLGDGRWGVKYLDGKDAGKFEKRNVVSVSEKPNVGLVPVETWNSGQKIHIGNEITKVNSNTGGVSHEPVSAPSPGGVPEIRPAPIAQSAQRFAYKKAARPGGYYDIYDKTDGTIVSSRKISETQAQALRDKYNSGEIAVGTGARDTFKPEHSFDENKQAIVTHGEPIPPSAGPEFKAKLEALADAHHKHAEADAKRYAAEMAYREKHGLPVEFNKPQKGLPDYDHGREAEDFEQNGGKMHVVSERNVTGKFRFRETSSKVDDAAVVDRLHHAESEAGKALKAAKDAVREEFEKGAKNGELPRSITIDHEKGRVNVRAVGPNLDFSNAPLAPPKMRQDIREIRSHAKTKESTVNYDEAATSTEPPSSEGFLSHFINSERGSAAPNANPLLYPLYAVDEGMKALKVGLTEGEKRGLKNTVNTMTAMTSVRRSLDFVKARSTELHNEIWNGIARETIFSRGIKFEPADRDLVEQSLRMEPEDIRRGSEGLDKFTAAQRNYLATRRAIRQNTAHQITSEILKMEEEHGSVEHMDKSDKTTYEVLKQLEDTMRGRSSKEGTTEGSEALGNLSSFLYDYVFKYNPSYHALNLLDPIVVGSSRVGISNIAKAKYILQADKNVAKFIGGTELKSPVQELRAETTALRSRDIERSPLGKAFNVVNKLGDMLPDLPSEKWNLNDSLAAGFIMRGEKVYGKGKGIKYLQDLANGKMGLDEKTAAFVDALQVTNDINGAGTHGLDKDFIQRNPMLKYVVQFTSQPYRVARLLKDYATSGNGKAIATFLAANALVGGRAALPKETDLLGLNPYTRKALYAVQDFMDGINVVKNLPYVGRDLTEKLRYSLIPALGGTGTNLFLDGLGEFFRNLHGKTFDKIAQSAMWASISKLLGGAGLEAAKLYKTAGNLQKGQKKEYAFPDTVEPNVIHKPIGSFSRKYGTPEALADTFLPGVSPDVGAFRKSKNRQFQSK